MWLENNRYSINPIQPIICWWGFNTTNQQLSLCRVTPVPELKLWWIFPQGSCHMVIGIDTLQEMWLPPLLYIPARDYSVTSAIRIHVLWWWAYHIDWVMAIALHPPATIYTSQPHHCFILTDNKLLVQSSNSSTTCPASICPLIFTARI